MTILQVRPHQQTVFGLEGGPHCSLHALIQDQIEAKALHEHGQHCLEFNHGERSTQAGTRAQAKGDESTRGMPLSFHRVEALGPKYVWFRELLWHAVAYVGGVHDNVARPKSVPLPLEGLTRD